jgi:hypothetical protein
MTKSRLASLIAIGAVFVGSVAAIAYAYDPESSAEAKADFCRSLSDLSSTVMVYNGLDPLTATDHQLDKAVVDIDEAWDEVVDDADDWANAYDNELDQALDNLYWDIQLLPGDYPVAETLEAVEDDLSALAEASRETFDGAGCAST